MHESADTSAGPGAPDAALERWAVALLGDRAAPLTAAHGSAAWTGTIAQTEVVLTVESGGHADGSPTARAVDFATRTGTPLVTVLVDGGGPLDTATLRATHLLSGVVPHLTIETGARTSSGRLRAAAADFSAAVTVERERDDPHFSDDHDAAAWAAAILRRIPANRSVPPPAQPPAPAVTDRRLTGSEDPVAVVAALTDAPPSSISPVSAALACGFAALDGHTVGTITSTSFAGDGSVSASDLRRAARFIDFCDAFRLPLMLALDIPGIAADTDAAALNPLARALSEASIPLVTLVTRRLGAPIDALVRDPALVPELLVWPGAASNARRSACHSADHPACHAAREIAPERTGSELVAALARWAGIDSPLPERRTSVAPR